MSSPLREASPSPSFLEKIDDELKSVLIKYFNELSLIIEKEDQARALLSPNASYKNPPKYFYGGDLGKLQTRLELVLPGRGYKRAECIEIKNLIEADLAFWKQHLPKRTLSMPNSKDTVSDSPMREVTIRQELARTTDRLDTVLEEKAAQATQLEHLEHRLKNAEEEKRALEKQVAELHAEVDKLHKVEEDNLQLIEAIKKLKDENTKLLIENATIQGLQNQLSDRATDQQLSWSKFCILALVAVLLGGIPEFFKYLRSNN